MTLPIQPIGDDNTAAIYAGSLASWAPDATVPVRAGWLADVMTRLHPGPTVQASGYDDLAQEARDARNRDALADVTADRLAFEDRG